MLAPKRLLNVNRLAYMTGINAGVYLKINHNIDLISKVHYQQLLPAPHPHAAHHPLPQGKSGEKQQCPAPADLKPPVAALLLYPGGRAPQPPSPDPGADEQNESPAERPRPLVRRTG